uniref:Uncharacterized protein n=1 Tax=Rhizophora mucronata TaxID=61149 RepID=A0A2P2MAA8_RHIMU
MRKVRELIIANGKNKQLTSRPQRVAGSRT